MTFFYNLNKTLDSIREKPEVTHGQLNERDMGKHNNKTTGFDALAKKAGKEYGSKAAGERVAGAQFQKMKKAGQLEEQGQLNELSPKLLQKARDAAGEKWSAADDRKDKKASAKYNAQDDKFNSAWRKKQKDMDEGLGDAVKQVGGMAKKLGQKAITTLGHGDDAAMMRDLQNKMNLPQTGMTPQQTQQAKQPPVAEEGDTSSPTKTTGGRANMPTSDVKSKYYPPAKPPVKKFAQPTTAFDRSKTGGLSTAYAPDQASRPAGMNPDPASRYAMGEEGGAKPDFLDFNKNGNTTEPMKKALADKKKSSFNNHIDNAKKEVDEMLGQVAAEAMKNALSPKQKKHIDKNHNGKIDANDFAMLRGEEMEEGWDDMIKDVEKRRGQTKKGEITHGHKHDIEDTGTGRRVTRRTDPNTGYSVGADSDEPASGEKRGRGRPKGAPKAPERVTGKAYKHKGGRKTTEDYGPMEETADFSAGEIQQAYRLAVALKMFVTDPDGKKALADLIKLIRYKLDQSNSTLGEKAPPGAKAERMVKHIKAGYAKDGELSDREKGIAYATAWKAKKAGKVEEESDETRDERAEKAGRKVAKDIEYDEKKKDGIHGKKRGGEDDKAEKAGKKVTKDIEYDEKKKKVKEQDNAGKSGGGMTFGKGIYDSLDRDVEKLISEGFNVSVNMSIDSNGEPTKNVSVNADGDDADKLAELLNLAGMQNSSYGGSGYKSACGCGQPNCSCGDDVVDEAYGDTDETQNHPDWPTNTEYSDDAFQYSGGLNKPKSTGQTTIPVVASQLERQHAYEAEENDLRRMMEMAGIQQDLKPWERTMKENAAAGYGAEMQAKIKTATPQQLNQMAYDLAGDSGPRYDYELKMLQSAQQELQGQSTVEEGVVDKDVNESAISDIGMKLYAELKSFKG